jgi:hypothetical protein
MRLATTVRLALVTWVALALLPLSVCDVSLAGERVEPTVKARLTGWVGRRDGYYLYARGATVRMVVTVWPNLQGERVRARLEWRRAGRAWRALEVSMSRLNRDSRALFLVRGVPEGYAFRIRARVPPGDGHRPGHSPWRYFRAV